MKLKELVELQMGYSFRGRMAFCKDGGTPVIQMKDFNTMGELVFAELNRVEESFKENHILKHGDLIFRSRGGSFSAAIIQPNIDLGQHVIAAPLMRIRVVDQATLNPEYLLWFLHQRGAQAFFHARSEGTTLQMISVKTLADLPVALPSIEKQNQIIELSELSKKEQSLMQILANKRTQFINEHLIQLAPHQKP